jgi:putative flippase GtrA
MGHRCGPPAVGVDVIARLIGDQRIRYLVVGGVSAVFYYAVFTAGWLTLSRWVPYVPIAAISTTLTAIATYPLYRRVVFRATGPYLPGFFRFYVICIWAMVFSIGGLAFLVEIVGLHPLVATLIILALGPVTNYQAGKLWAFRRRKESHAV